MYTYYIHISTLYIDRSIYFHVTQCAVEIWVSMPTFYYYIQYTKQNV